MKNRVGEKHITNEGYKIEIAEYHNKRNCKIKFEDGSIIRNREYGAIVKGSIKNPYHKSVYGIGYFGVGIYSQKTHSKTYKTWSSMLERCYDTKYHKKNPTYKGCSVDEIWHNFQIFAEWFEKNYKENYQLDKDILLKGNKVYFYETCVFLPQEINKLLVKSNSKRGEYPLGVSKHKNKFRAEININNKPVYLGVYDTPEEAFQVYKTTKEKNIKEVAEKWKEQITEPAYTALINYKVEITD